MRARHLVAAALGQKTVQRNTTGARLRLAPSLATDIQHAACLGRLGDGGDDLPVHPLGRAGPLRVLPTTEVVLPSRTTEHPPIPRRTDQRIEVGKTQGNT